MQDGEGEGELGCSDVPGWGDGSSNAVLKPSVKEMQHKYRPAAVASKAKNQKRNDSKGPLVDRTAISEIEPKAKAKAKPVDDGTDDYLHQRLDMSAKSQGELLGSLASSHADIQSIQEGAEIAGKIVLLSRGGCGFLEKVKWAQRRGAIALIVGDNQRGGPLIQMYAHGDTSNVTIPSIFTSRTTAYLLSLMMQPGSFIEDLVDENGKPSLKVQQSDKTRKNKKARHVATSGQPPKTSSKPNSAKIPITKKHSPASSEASGSRLAWLSKAFSWGPGPNLNSAASGSRPPSSGQLDWVVVEDFSDEKDKIIKNSLERASKVRSNADSKDKTKKIPDDTFQIGVEDWRDPDLLGPSDKDNMAQDAAEGNSKPLKSKPKSDQASNTEPSDKKQGGKVLMNGRVTPNSGEYAASRMPVKGVDAFGSTKGKTSISSSGGLISKIFGDDDDSDDDEDNADLTKSKPINPPNVGKPGSVSGESSEEREGLWVVITPSSGASPFFDTLLVLVVSPLITLTVVYALLILRARIRRRRWRAPKSVVERLPVRTYHTVASTPSRTSRVPSPTSSSPTTPLLQNQHGPSRQRPRSQTTTGVLSAGDFIQADSSTPRSTPRAHEKRNTHTSSEWKKYMGRQVECVVCLEEYVDGVSQVMSLPCGHEFHVDCITPWLITRRRTCPICKGDVVRSLARGMPSSPRYEPYQDDSDDDLDEPATASSLPDDPLGRADDADVEQGTPVPPHTSHQDGWLNTLRNSFRTGLLSRSRRAPEDDDNRDR